MMHVEDILSTVGYHEYHGDTQYLGGYHDACGGYHVMMMHGGGRYHEYC